MTRLQGIHHLAFVSNDLDRLIAFYRRLFEAEVTLDLTEGPVRHVFIDVGRGAVLHAFQIPGVDAPPPGQPMFERGRLDHVALTAPDADTFWDLRDRIVSEGAGDGDVTDMGSLLLVGFVDPDGAAHEVVWNKTGVPASAGLPRASWNTLTERPPQTR